MHVRTTDTTHHYGDAAECICSRCAKFASIDLTKKLLRHASIETEWEWVANDKHVCPALDATALLYYLTDAHIEIECDTFTIQTKRGEHFARWHKKDMLNELVRFALNSLSQPCT